MILGAKQSGGYSGSSFSFGRGASLIRWEGNKDSSGSPGSSNRIWELIIFSDGMMELRIGDWATGTSGITGIYTSSGIGTSFTVSANTSYVFDATSSSPSNVTINSGYTYQRGELIAGNALPWLGSSATSTSISYQSIFPEENIISETTRNVYIRLNSHVDNGSAYLSSIYYGVNSGFPIFGTSHLYSYMGSNSYITFGSGSGSSASTNLSSTNPAYDKIMVDAGNRSYDRVIMAGLLVF